MQIDFGKKSHYQSELWILHFTILTIDQTICPNRCHSNLTLMWVINSLMIGFQVSSMETKL